MLTHVGGFGFEEKTTLNKGWKGLNNDTCNLKSHVNQYWPCFKNQSKSNQIMLRIGKRQKEKEEADPFTVLRPPM